MKCKEMPDVEELRKLFYYNDKKGILYYKIDAKCKHKGGLAGFITNQGYLRIMIKGSRYYVHHIIWTMYYGSIPQHLEVDHIDGDPLNNNINNLRLVTNRENGLNVKRGKNNTSGCMGVHFDFKLQKWVARISTKGKRISLGYYFDKEIAISVRKTAEKEHGYHKNHDREA